MNLVKIKMNSGMIKREKELASLSLTYVGGIDEELCEMLEGCREMT